MLFDAWIYYALVLLLSYFLFLIRQSIPQGVLHWVAEPSPGVDPLKVEIRLFDRLFLSEVGHHYFLRPRPPLSLKIFLNLMCVCVCVRILLSSMIGLLI